MHSSRGTIPFMVMNSGKFNKPDRLTAVILKQFSWLHYHGPMDSQSPNITALENCLWKVLVSEACSTPRHNIEALKSKLKKVWDKIAMETLCTAINDFSADFDVW